MPQFSWKMIGAAALLAAGIFASTPGASALAPPVPKESAAIAAGHSAGIIHKVGNRFYSSHGGRFSGYSGRYHGSYRSYGYRYGSRYYGNRYGHRYYGNRYGHRYYGHRHHRYYGHRHHHRRYYGNGGYFPWYGYGWGLGFPGIYGYYGASYYEGPQSYYSAPQSGDCGYWSQQCIKNWGYQNSNYYGCMRYQGCN